MASMREALEAAFDDAEEVQEQETAAATPPAAPPAAEPPPPEEETEEEEVAAPPPVEKKKDEPSNARTNQKPANNEQQAGRPTPTVPPGKSPVSWRPEIREKFGALPKDIQDEVMRRESEINNGLRDASESRRFHREFSEMATPYQAIFNAERVTPVQAAADLFRSAYMLRTGTPQQKADLVAGLIQNFGIDLNTLDGILSARIAGKPAPNSAEANTMQYIDQQLRPVVDFVREQQGVRQQTQQQTQQNLSREIDDFASKSEFYNDVAPDIADLLDMAARRGQAMTLQEAYDRATMLHPEISKVISARKVSQNAAQRTAAAKKARQAGASVSQGAPSTEARPRKAVSPNSSEARRAAIEAAWDSLDEAS